ncbi:hypothetical protein BGX34_004310 [Mortierella sp. NVP85]|nr:hypothetical protein BGX34_004310 [Mortierella sp. NVP85]
MTLLWREMREFTRRRHAYLMSEKHSKTPQSTTILVTAIPKGLSTEDALYEIFNRFPGGVTKVWLNRQPKKIVKLCKERDELVKSLEMAEYQYIRSAYRKKNKKDTEIKEPQRPFGRISKIPFKGEKVDLIDHYANRLSEINKEIKKAQESGSVQLLNSAFIQFRSQFGAHSAVQTVVHPTPFHMAPMFAEISPLDVVWDNMNLDTVARKGRHMVILVLSTAMILLSTIPTVLISQLASFSEIINLFKFLAFLEGLPPKVQGIIQGVLPPLLLAGLMALLPFLLTVMATYEGHERFSSITRSVMSKYFFFLVTNVLLISTISGGIVKTWSDIKGEGFKFELVIGRFSEKLPQSSTFFVTYVLLRGLTGPALELLQIVPLLLNFFFTQLLAKSPHQIWDVQGRLQAADYGILFPPQTLIFCIGIVYSTIAPLILPFVTFYFTMHYFVYRHQFLYVYQQPVETGGVAFPTAVKQVYTGMFISQITLFGLFLMKQAAMTKPAVPQLVLVVILVVITSLSLGNMNEAFNPLVEFLPVALFSKDLHVDKDGVVTEGSGFSWLSRFKPWDEEVGREIGVDDERNDDMTCPDNSSNHFTRAWQALTRQFKREKRDIGTHSTTENGVVTASSSSPPTKNLRDSGVHEGDKDDIIPATSKTVHFAPSTESIRQRHPPTQRQNSTYSTSSNGSMRDRPVSFVDRPMSYRNSRLASSTHLQALIDDDEFHSTQPEKSERDKELERLQDRAYCHPAIYDVQTPVWLPMDERGLVQAEIDKLKSLGIVVATDGAILDASTAKAKVSGIIYAPGEEERYRLERGE